MILRKNITTSDQAVTLIDKNSNFGRSQTLKKITISNNSDNPATIIVDLFDGSSTQFYICKNVIIPKGVVLVLEDNLSFKIQNFNLRIYNTGSSPDLTIMIA